SLLAGALPELPSSVLPSPALRDGRPPGFGFDRGGAAYLGVAQGGKLGGVARRRGARVRAAQPLAAARVAARARVRDRDPRCRRRRPLLLAPDCAAARCTRDGCG